jgi:hypothetical protein
MICLTTFYFEKAGPREGLFFEPGETKAAVVTCGGVCPGLNNVIRSAVLEFYYNYGVQKVLGIRYGYAGLNPRVGLPPVELKPQSVSARRTQSFGSVFAELLSFSTGLELRLCPTRSERALATSDHGSRLYRGARGTQKRNEILAGLGC